MTPPQAEGVAAAKSFIQPVGELRQACSLVITPATIRVFPSYHPRHHAACGRAARGMLRSYHPPTATIQPVGELDDAP